MKSLSVQFNVDFIKLIEKNPCIWNYSLDTYSQRDYVKEAWQAIAKEVKQSEENCRDRWRTIRNSFVKAVHKRGGFAATNRKYYLAEYLSFLTPFMRAAPILMSPTPAAAAAAAPPLRNVQEDEEISMMFSSIVDVGCDDELEYEQRKNEAERSTTDIDTDTDPEMIENRAPSPVHVAKKRRLTKQQLSKVAADDELGATNAELYNPLVKNESPISAAAPESAPPTSMVDDSDELYAGSLVRFMKQMTSRQNRRFRLKVMMLVDDIFENVDVVTDAQPEEAVASSTTALTTATNNSSNLTPAPIVKRTKRERSGRSARI